MVQRMSVWSYVADLGATVERLWREQRGSEDHFPEVAARALVETPVPDGVDARAVLRAAVETESLVPQSDRAGTFGQPPITLFRARDFYIDVLLWMDGTPSIHEHSFSGAFRVLDGSSVHVPYQFEPQEVVTRRFMFGNLRVAGGEVLRQGDVRSIVAGDAGIHSLFHLERPSATVVVRTYQEPWAEPQRVFFRPGIAYDSAYKDASLSRRLDALATLWRVDRDGAIALGMEMVSKADPFGAFLIVDNWFRRVDSSEGISEIIDILVNAHGLPAELHEMFADRRREGSLLARRQMLHLPRHRLLLAVLVTLPDPRTRAKILSAFFPDRDAGSLLSDLVAELCSPALRGLSGLVLGESDLAALRQTLEEGSDDTAADAQLRQMSTRVRNLDLVKALLP